MIIKVSTRKEKGSYAKLASYICEPKKEASERVEKVWTDNFEGDQEDWEVASWEVEALHKCKADIDKDMSYHLIVSFRPEEAEKLSNSDFENIAQEVTEAVGIGSHHRITAIHGDTKNKHMHIAASLLDSENRFIEPYQAYHSSAQKRSEIEKRYGFLAAERGGEPELSDANTKREKHGNLASFEGWLKKHVAHEMRSLLVSEEASWSAVHSLLKSNGVELRKRGAGFVFAHLGEKLFVKASSIDRGFSAKNLIAQLGSWETAKGAKGIEVKRSYEKKPTGAEMLFRSYQEENERLKLLRTDSRAKAKKRYLELKEDLNSSIRSRKDEILTAEVGDVKLQRAYLKKLTFERKQKLEGLLADYSEELKRVKVEYKRKTWLNFLRSRAQDGDIEAIRVLQRKGISDYDSLLENKIYTKEEGWLNVGTTYRDLSCRVLGNGELVYQTKVKAEIRDRGARLIVGEQFDDAKVEASLKLAIAKYGKTLYLSGSEEFKKSAIRVAEENGLDCRFSSRAKTYMEKQRERRGRA